MGADLIVMCISGRSEPVQRHPRQRCGQCRSSTPPGRSSWPGSGPPGPPIRLIPGPALCWGQPTRPPSADREPANPRQRWAVQAPRRSFRSSWCHRPRQRLPRAEVAPPAAPGGTSRSPSVCGLTYVRPAGLATGRRPAPAGARRQAQRSNHGRATGPDASRDLGPGGVGSRNTRSCFLGEVLRKPARGAQFVGDVGGKLAAGLLGSGQVGRHVVEGDGELAQLAGCADPSPSRPVSGGERAGGRVATPRRARHRRARGV